MTPSLMNFLLSLVAGAAVLGAIFGGVLFISQQDKVRRR
ncbi:MAG: Photosystem II reaction center X protein [Synechococcaceae cyanobacterium RM1_1_27]|nr:Photosystem II reaction center X protein [Synechococcaceae cyanobacterium RM1_1_27]